MTRIIELANQYADGLITSTEFRNYFAVELIKLDDEDALFLLATLLLRTEAKVQ